MHLFCGALAREKTGECFFYQAILKNQIFETMRGILDCMLLSRKTIFRLIYFGTTLFEVFHLQLNQYF